MRFSKLKTKLPLWTSLVFQVFSNHRKIYFTLEEPDPLSSDIADDGSGGGVRMRVSASLFFLFKVSKNIFWNKAKNKTTLFRERESQVV